MPRRTHVSHRLSTIEAAVEAIAAGQVVIVMDAEDRENEGDFICAAEKVTPEIVNFMITHGRGQLCMPILPETAERLDLPPIVREQHGPAADGLHRAGGSSQLPHGRHRARSGPRRSRRSSIRTSKPADFVRPGPPLPAGGQGGRRAAAGRPYRVRRRSGPDGRPEAGRRAHRNPRPERRSGHAARSSTPWPKSSSWKSSPSRR